MLKNFVAMMFCVKKTVQVPTCDVLSLPRHACCKG